MPTQPLRPRHPMAAVALVAVIVAGLAACGPAADEAAPDARDEQIEQLEAEVAELEAEVERLRAQAPEDGAQDPAGDPGVDRPAPPRSPDGLVEQLRTLFPADPDLGFAPAATPWEPTEVPAGFGEGQAAFSTAGELVAALAAELAGGGLGSDVWEVTARVLFDQAEGDPDAQEATGAVLLWGFLDDSVAGSDHRFDLRRGPDGWFAASAEQRSQCARGVTEGLCV